jgi:iron only hydrogenase large subunit-like protein
VSEANVAQMEDGHDKIHIDDNKCIACGACLEACQHGVRDFVDDTARFFEDLSHGKPISLFFAPASRSNLENWKRILTLLRDMGVRKVYDVSLGADICTWANIRYIQQKKTASVITQPCPVIVNYILRHRPELLPYLSPAQSPMLCTAIYMRKYQGITDRLAALSPCVAKSNEFEDTGDLVSYNVTFIKLEEYIREHRLVLPEKESGYDHIDSALGSIFSMPGGLKENVEFMLGKELRIDKSEGQNVVYRKLDAFAKEPVDNLPALFDVLNCPEGCNQGTGCRHNSSFFAINKAMDAARHNAVKERDREYFEEMYRTFDKTLRLSDFLRRYYTRPARSIHYNDDAVEDAFRQLGKMDDLSRNFDCGACGSDTCRSMAIKIARKINIPENCIHKAHADLQDKVAQVLNWQHNADSILTLHKDSARIKDFADRIVKDLANVKTTIGTYETMTKDINKIASNIHMISLNASIEAARAGIYGKPFSVVAEAIRSLASETQKTIMNITSTSVETKKAMDGITEMVVAIGNDITKSHDNISKLTSTTMEMLETDKTE